MMKKIKILLKKKHNIHKNIQTKLKCFNNQKNKFYKSNWVKKI